MAQATRGLRIAFECFRWLWFGRRGRAPRRRVRWLWRTAGRSVYARARANGSCLKWRVARGEGEEGVERRLRQRDGQVGSCMLRRSGGSAATQHVEPQCTGRPATVSWARCMGACMGGVSTALAVHRGGSEITVHRSSPARTRGSELGACTSPRARTPAVLISI